MEISQQPPIHKDLAWIFLLSQEVIWSEVQQNVETAALLSPKCCKAGWYMYPANLSQEVISRLKQIPNQQQNQVNLISETLDQLIGEFYQICQISYEQGIPQEIVSVKQNVLQEVNKFIRSRGTYYQWTESDYMRVLNHNMQVISSKITKEMLPSNLEISIELIYGLMISYYGMELLQECPQLAVLMVICPLVYGLDPVVCIQQEEPRHIKSRLLQNSMSKKNNVPVPNDFYNKKFVDCYEMADELQKYYDIIQYDKQYSKNQRNRLAKMIRLLTTQRIKFKQEKYTCRQSILNEHFYVNNDYKQDINQDWEIIFYEGLKQSLNRLTTDISVANNNTLRNVKRHLLFKFLLKKSPQQLQEHISKEYIKAEKTLKNLAQIAQQTRRLGYMKSDWQNKIARHWQLLRSTIIQQINQTQEQMVVPPPFQYCLALDLFPQAHPFSFTHGRKQGYCIDYKNSLKWYLQSCNKSEKGYFYALIENPKCHTNFNFLEDIPQDIRLINKKLKESLFMEQLDEWLINNSNSNLKIIKVIENFIQNYIKQAPLFIQKKIQNPKIISALALFDSIFHIYYPEDVYLDNTLLPLPPLHFDPLPTSPQYNQFDYWGPPYYGGKFNQENM